MGASVRDACAARKRGLISLSAGALMICGSLLAGCGTYMAPPRGPDGLVYNYQPSDIPVPLGFSVSENEFETWADITFKDGPLGLRTGRFTYYGDKPLSELSLWFLDQMPKEGWTHADTTDRDDVRMVFKKTGEDAEIRMERIPDERDKYYITRLTVRISPSLTN
ncbi:MAG: hypothetical protein ACKVX7_19585 [Planctomycetota bacterium]